MNNQLTSETMERINDLMQAMILSVEALDIAERQLIEAAEPDCKLSLLAITRIREACYRCIRRFELIKQRVEFYNSPK